MFSLARHERNRVCSLLMSSVDVVIFFCDLFICDVRGLRLLVSE